ncbi:MAG: hypothetical protein AVDCRST_MAG08-148, partial [uncultured Acetobacteraceae bacterium]
MRDGFSRRWRRFAAVLAFLLAAVPAARAQFDAPALTPRDPVPPVAAP